MKKEWFTSLELAEAKLPGLPHTRQGIENFISQSGIRSTGLARTRDGRGGGYEYHFKGLPSAARQKIAFMNTELPPEKTNTSKMLWQRFEALTKEHRDICQRRLDVLLEADAMQKSGISVGEAVRHCARKADICIRTFYEWQKMVEGHARQDWLAALAPSSSPGTNGVITELSECHPTAWDVLTSDYLRPEEPAFSACYRRMCDVAKRKGWSPIPSERTLRRRMDLLVPKAVQTLARKGKEEAKKLFPAQRRSVAHLQAMQMTNTDGHKLDLRVLLENGNQVDRVFLMAIQDLYSRKLLSWVLCEAETWEAVRTVVGNMVETYGIPEHLYMDNGKAFASKKISGQAKKRHRFKITEDEVAGLLKTLGIEAHFVLPYSGQSKPIERSWGDLAENISKHPAMAGCYTGRSTSHKPENYGQRAVPIAELEKHVAMCIEEHNARIGRRTETARGRSFDQVFEESIANPANTAVRFASPSQRSLWMLTAETLTARKPDGSIHLSGNRYWDPQLNQWIGKKLTVRFDPSNLHGAVKIYDPRGRFLCDARCVDDSGFDCAAAARTIAKARKAKQRDNEVALKSARRLKDLELAELMSRGRETSIARQKPAPPVVTRLVTRNPLAGNLAQAIPDEAFDGSQHEDSFARGLSRMAGGDAAILRFPTTETASGRRAGRKNRADK